MFVVPMFESERGWGCRIDGYAGPFNTLSEAKMYQDSYNKKYNNETSTPDWYIVAEDPIAYTHQKCEYK